MLELVILLLGILWLLGFIQLPILPLKTTVLFNLLGKPVTLYDLLVFLLVLWVIGILPSPFREIAGVMLVIYILSILGIIAIAGFSQIVVMGIIIGLILYVLQ